VATMSARAMSRGCVSGLLQVRQMGAGEPALTQTRVDRLPSSPQRVDVGMIGGTTGRHHGAHGNSPMAGDQDIDVPGTLTQPVECRLIGAQPDRGGEGRGAEIRTSESMSPVSRTPWSSRRTAAWPMACA
jgi:hypothetical protein